jgi:hypothetical protein
MSTAYRSENGSADSDGTERTVGQLFASATADLSALVHDEIALAKQELTKSAKRGATGGAVGAAAAVILLASVPMFSFATAYGIHALGVTLGWSFFIVAWIFVVLAAVAGFFAYRLFTKLSAPEQTIASSKATVDVLKNAKPHPAPTMK